MDLAADPYEVMTAFVATGASLVPRHQAHLLAVGIPVVMLVAGLGWDSLRHRRLRPRTVLPLSRALELAAAASLLAAAVHGAVVPEHLRESALYGAFFIGAAVGQLTSAGLLLRFRSHALVKLIAVGNAAVISLWLVTRVVGVPIGPDAGATEPFQPLDVAASTFEALVVIGCVAALCRMPTVRALRRAHV